MLIFCVVWPTRVSVLGTACKAFYLPAAKCGILTWIDFSKIQAMVFFIISDQCLDAVRTAAFGVLAVKMRDWCAMALKGEVVQRFICCKLWGVFVCFFCTGACGANVFVIKAGLFRSFPEHETSMELDICACPCLFTSMLWFLAKQKSMF